MPSVSFWDVNMKTRQNVPVSLEQHIGSKWCLWETSFKNLLNLFNNDCKSSLVFSTVCLHRSSPGQHVETDGFKWTSCQQRSSLSVHQDVKHCEVVMVESQDYSFIRSSSKETRWFRPSASFNAGVTTDILLLRPSSLSVTPTHLQQYQTDQSLQSFILEHELKSCSSCACQFVNVNKSYWETDDGPDADREIRNFSVQVHWQPLVSEAPLTHWQTLEEMFTQQWQ